MSELTMKQLEQDQAEFIEALNDFCSDHYKHFNCYPLEFEYNNKVYKWEEFSKHINKIVCPVCDTEYKLSEIEEPTECEQCGHYWIAIPNLEDKGE